MCISSLRKYSIIDQLKSCNINWMMLNDQSFQRLSCCRRHMQSEIRWMLLHLIFIMRNHDMQNSFRFFFFWVQMEICIQTGMWFWMLIYELMVYYWGKWTCKVHKGKRGVKVWFSIEIFYALHPWTWDTYKCLKFNLMFLQCNWEVRANNKNPHQ